MKRLHTAGAGLLVIVGILFLAGIVRAGIPEPDVIYYGAATHKGGVEPATEQITLVLNATSEQVAAYTPGDIPEYEDRYVLRVPMDALASIEGQSATFYIGGRLAGTTHIPARGSIVQLDVDTLSSNDSDNDGMDDTWEMQYFKTLARDGTEDINGNGIKDLEEYRGGTDPTAAVWQQVGDTLETCVFHPAVLQRALNAAATDRQNNRIKLQAGIYTGKFSYVAEWGEDFDLEIVGGFGDECVAAAAALTVLDGNGEGPVLTLDTATGQTQGNIRVLNLYITNGSATEGGGIAFLADTGGLTLLNNIITENSATAYGGGISLRVQGAAQTLLVANNTIHGNAGGGIYCSSPQSSAVVKNNIITNNLSGEGIRAEGVAPDSDYNNLWNNESGGYNDPAFQGGRDVSTDPLFVAAAGGDFSLQVASPCIDAGKNENWLPGFDIQGKARITDGNVDGTYRVDMGSHESTGASPLEGCDPFTDEDCDGVVDALDQCPGSVDADDADLDGVPDGCDRCPDIDDLADNDHDDMLDCWEELNGLDPGDPADADEDADGDDFSNLREYLAGTDPNDDTSAPQNKVPGVPIPVSPPNQSQVGDVRPTLVVENATDDDLTPPVYEFEVYAEQGMSAPIATSGHVEQGAGISTAWQVNVDLEENKTYRWRVRAKDDAANTGAWSNFFNFFVNTANDAPNPPSLHSPQSGAEVATVEPVLTVNNATDEDQDALTYEFEIDTESTFSNPKTAEMPQGTGNTTSWTPAPLDENTRYYWRARACDAEGCSAWMTTADFFVNRVNDPPSIPGISAPPDGALVTTFQPVLEVTNAGDPDEDPLTYEFELYADEAMATPITSGDGLVEEWDGTTSWRVDETLQNNRAYWWRARARDDAGQPGGWSKLFSFTISTSNAAPSAPTIVTPQYGAEVQTLEPALVIYNATDPNNDPITYYFDIDRLNSFNSTALQRSSQLPEGVGGMTSWRPPLPLTGGTTYYWRVIAYDGASYSGWTGGWFVVNLANDPPTTPVVINPQEGAEVQTLAPALVISNATDPNMDAVVYYFEIDKEDSFNGTARQQSPPLSQGVGGMTSWRPSTLSDNTTYHWRVIAHDGRSFSDWTGGSFFVNLANDPPTTPEIQSPGQGDEVVTLAPVLKVNEATDADGDPLTYDYEVYADPNGITLVRSAQGTATSWQVGADLEEDTHYWWRFRAGDDEGATSAWSALFTFFVNAVNDAPSAPSVNRPQEGWAVETLVPMLEVNNASDVDDDTLTYEFEIDTRITFSSSARQSATITQGAENTTSWSPAALEDHTTYYWRVRAWDEESCSEWMETAVFFVNTSNEPPSIPRVSAPPDGSFVATSKPTLEVTNASDPDQEALAYEFEVYGDAAMNWLITRKTGVLEEEDGTTAWRVSSWLSNKKTYWWRARAVDHEGAASGWSDPVAFTVNWKNGAPTVPSIITPEESGEVGTLDPVLEVNNAQDVNQDTLTYFFEIDTVNTFDSPALRKSPEVQEGAGQTTSWSLSGLDDNTLYYWRARAFDGETYGDWRTGSFFVNLANEPPETPAIQNPDQGCVLTISRPTLSVFPSADPDLNEITYEYELYLEADPINPVTAAQGAGTSWQVDVSLEHLVPYYWIARAVDEHGLASDWCPAVSFSVNTRNARPGSPTLNNPYNAGIVTTLTPTLSVNHAVDQDHGVLTYEFELYADVGLTDKVASATLSQGDLITSWKVGTELTDQATYYWRARANDGVMAGSWMNTALFAVDTAAAEICVVPACAKEVSAAAQGTQVVEVTRRWSPINGVSVEIPSGALREDCTVTIGMVENPPALPPNTKAISRVIDFGPDGTTFEKPVTVRIPYTLEDLFNAGVSDPALLEIWTFNGVAMAWEAVPVDHVEGWFLICYVDHFSMYTTGKSVSSATSATTGAASGGGGGCFIDILARGPRSYVPLGFAALVLMRAVWRRRRGE